MSPARMFRERLAEASLAPAPAPALRDAHGHDRDAAAAERCLEFLRDHVLPSTLACVDAERRVDVTPAWVRAQIDWLRAHEAAAFVEFRDAGFWNGRHAEDLIAETSLLVAADAAAAAVAAASPPAPPEQAGFAADLRELVELHLGVVAFAHSRASMLAGYIADALAPDGRDLESEREAHEREAAFDRVRALDEPIARDALELLARLEGASTS